jgi:hypothetical protein
VRVPLYGRALWLSLVWFDGEFADRMVLSQDDFDDRMILLQNYFDDERRLIEGWFFMML